MRLSFALLLLLADYVLGSPGDRLSEFQDCNDACEHRRTYSQSQATGLDISENEFSHIAFKQTPILLQWLLFWDYRADCDYQCQQIVTRDRIVNNKEMHQFHGKWPFIRLFGMQEFFSVIFSVGNFLPHYYGYQKLLKRLNMLQYRGKAETSPSKLLKSYMLVAVAGMLAWSASSIFHLRDLLITEKLDYFFAGGTVLSGFHAIFTRIARLDRHPFLSRLFTWSVILIFGLHILRLYIDWSYTYNMRFNVLFGLLQYILLLLLAFNNYKLLQKQPKSKIRPNIPSSKNIKQLCLMPVILVLTTASGMSFELFDFFNYRWQIDSHALWHLCTIWPSWELYEFFIADFNFVTREVSN